ncbi:MAG TPA: hypothetical protein VEW03_13805 [Longimicrobiaceae bacterium]|nr:hypothetical protein [Longimicrobiaceae bacterium]
MTPPAAGAPGPSLLPLLEDGALRMEVDPGLLPLLRRWLPLLPYHHLAAAPAAAVLRVLAGDPAGAARPPGAPVLRLGSVDAWVEGDRAWLAGTAGCSGALDLARREARLAAPAAHADPDAVAWDLYSMATLSAALLLGRMGRALAHTAAVVAPGGGAWLLAGDAFAGKTTTCANLAESGWGYVSDDHLVLYRGADGEVRVEGWPRRFHVDEGWEAGAPVRRRGELDPHARWPGRWRRTAPLAGLLFPRVDAELPTALAPLPAADALAALMRQSPWLLADFASAGEVLGLLRAACERPAFTLRLGLDSYRDTARLRRVLRPATGG